MLSTKTEMLVQNLLGIVEGLHGITDSLDQSICMFEQDRELQTGGLETIRTEWRQQLSDLSFVQRILEHLRDQLGGGWVADG